MLWVMVMVMAVMTLTILWIFFLFVFLILSCFMFILSSIIYSQSTLSYTHTYICLSTYLNYFPIEIEFKSLAYKHYVKLHHLVLTHQRTLRRYKAEWDSCVSHYLFVNKLIRIRKEHSFFSITLDSFILPGMYCLCCFIITICLHLSVPSVYECEHAFSFALISLSCHSLILLSHPASASPLLFSA